MKKVLALLALLLLIAPAMAQNETNNDTMEPENGTADPSQSSSPPATEGEGGSKTIVWIIVIVALAGLLYAYGRLKKTE